MTKVDIVIATGKFGQMESLQNYTDTFKALLDVSTNNIISQVSSVETSTISSDDFDIDKILNSWTQYGAHVWASQGGTLVCSLPGGTSVGNGSWQATMIIDPTGYDTTDSVIEFDVDASSADLMEGPCWRVTQNPDGTFNGYFLNVGSHWHKGISLMKFTNIDMAGDFSRGDLGGLIWCGFTGPSWRQGTGWSGAPAVTIEGNSRVTTAHGHRAVVTHLDTYPTEISGKLRIEMKSSHIDVLLNGNIIMQADDTSYPSGTYGFWGNNCEMRTSMKIKNLVITRGASKSLGEAVQDVSWRDGSVRFIIYAEDEIPVEFDPENENRDADLAYTIAKVTNSNAYLIGLGNTTSKDCLQQLIDSIKHANNEVMGIYYENTPINNAMNESAYYIIDKCKNYGKATDWLLVNTNIKWNTEYRDGEHDLPLNYGEHSKLNTDRAQPQDLYDETIGLNWGVPLTSLKYKDAKILAEKWRYRHFNNFFDNSPIQVGYHQVWIEDPIDIFDYPGKYRINYKRRDNPLYPSVALDNDFDNYRYWSTDYDYRVTQG